MERFGDKVQCNPTVKLKKGKQYPLVDIDKIIPGYKFVSNVEVCDYNGQGGAKYQNRDVLMARITPCLENGKIALADIQGNEGIGSTELLVFRGIDGVSDTDYIYYLLNTKYMRQLAANSMTGASGRQRADLKFIKKIPWKFPALKQQKEISAVLSQYDNLIVINKKRIKLLETTAQQLYKEGFVRFRFPGYEKAKFVDGIPQGWEIVPIGTQCEVVGGATPSTEVPSNWNGDIKWVTPTDITRKNALPLIDIEGRITMKGLKSCATKLLPPETILMTSRASIGYIGLTKDSVCTNQGFISVLPNYPNMKMYFVYMLLSRRDELINYANGSTFLEISRSNFKKLKMLLPSENILHQFENITANIFDEEYALEQQNKHLTKQRDLLLPRLMSGKLAV